MTGLIDGKAGAERVDADAGELSVGSVFGGGVGSTLCQLLDVTARAGG